MTEMADFNSREYFFVTMIFFFTWNMHIAMLMAQMMARMVMMVLVAGPWMLKQDNDDKDSNHNYNEND